MKRIQGIYIFFLIVALSVQVAALPAPDVKHVTESKFEFKGPLGLMMRLFGGNKPTKTVTYLKGNVLRSDQFDSKGRLTQSQILTWIAASSFKSIIRKNSIRKSVSRSGRKISKPCANPCKRLKWSSHHPKRWTKTRIKT